MSKTKFSKEDLKDKLDGNELDLSLCNLSKVPVREIVSAFLLVRILFIGMAPCNNETNNDVPGSLC
jgi:hypothetical protein